jgi:DNA-binding XRE family transcriptional regulator/tetratricopeptide (TPR) repeat protein
MDDSSDQGKWHRSDLCRGRRGVGRHRALAQVIEVVSGVCAVWWAVRNSRVTAGHVPRSGYPGGEEAGHRRDATMIEPTQRAGARGCAGCGAALASDNTARLCGKCHREQRDQLAYPPRHKREFFDTDEFKSAFDSHHIGRVFRAYRNHPRHLHLYGKALNQELLGRWLGLTQAQVSKLENGKPEQNIEVLSSYAKTLHLPQDMLWWLLPGQSRIPLQSSVPAALDAPSGKSLEDLRSGLTDVFTSAFLRDSGVDGLEQDALRMGRATRFTSPDLLVRDLESNLTDLRQIIANCRSDALSRRLARVGAQLAGLMSLSLLKLDDRANSGNWARTARLLASETGDPNLRSWVQAQESYFQFYDQNYAGTVDAAQYAQELESTTPGVGSALAAAIEARAYALMGDRSGAMRAMARVETYLSHLAGDAVVPSAFGYNEAQFRFHQGSALTRLGVVTEALKVQDRALEICPQEDFMDRALVLFDRADCLAIDGDVASAIELATNTLETLESSQARGLIVNRARETLLALPAGELHRPGAMELQEVISSLSEDQGGSSEIGDRNG